MDERSTNAGIGCTLTDAAKDSLRDEIAYYISRVRHYQALYPEHAYLNGGLPGCPTSAELIAGNPDCYKNGDVIMSFLATEGTSIPTLAPGSYYITGGCLSFVTHGQPEDTCRALFAAQPPVGCGVSCTQINVSGESHTDTTPCNPDRCLPGPVNAIVHHY